MDLEPKRKKKHKDTGRNVWIIHGSFEVTLVTLATKMRLHFSLAAGVQDRKEPVGHQGKFLA